MQTLSTKHNLSPWKICAGLALSYTSLMRWSQRRRRNRVLIGRPGPQKTQRIDVAQIQQELRRLHPSGRRSTGTGLLKATYREYLSRRALAELVREVRLENNRREKRIAWHTPGLAWAVDGAQVERFDYQQMRDLASQYKFAPLAGICGEEVAGYLDHMFGQYGPPLFLKRDNGGNLNHAAVNEVLRAYQVIPLNSPNQYPEYNGAIEHDQGELKQALRQECSLSVYPAGKHLPVYLRSAVNELNHKPRRNLGNRNSCRVFFDRKEGCTFSMRQRRSIFDWLKQRASFIIDTMKDASAKALKMAWRLAVEHWLRINGHITVSINGKVLPNLSPKISH